VNAPLPGAPREPEIELLARIARRGLIAARCVLFVAGLGAIAFAVIAAGGHAATAPGAEDSAAARVAHHAVWVCAGLPLLLRTDWLLGRGRLPMLGVGIVLWFGPAAVDGDHEYGFVLRMFASLVACATLLVWRTVFALTRRQPNLNSCVHGWPSPGQ
jgi:hypothetical protein